MYLNCNKKTLSRLSEDAFRVISLEVIKYQLTKSNFSVDDVSHFIKGSNSYFFLFLCPYCKATAILSTSKRMGMKPFVCVFCGETDPFYKTETCLEKVKTIKDMIISIQGENDKSDISEKRIRILLEQCIVLLASVFEIFLRDVHSILMNVRYVKENKSLYKKFYLDSKNDFINLGKATQKYKNDLSIDLKSKLNKTERGSIDLLLNKRHLIVHNNGVVDSTFLSQTGLNLKIKDLVPIELDEISGNVNLIRHVIKMVGFSYKRDVGKELIERINNQYGIKKD